MLSAVLHRVSSLLQMIKFEHTIFALPFAATAAIVAAGGWPSWATLGWILLAMVGARSAAMAFNRIVDARYDALNPRTAARAIPAGLISMRSAAVFTLVAAVVFLFAAWRLNSLAFALSPLALFIILGYSYTKRFTPYSHLVLGLSLAIAPVGAWVAVTGSIALPPIILASAVMLWTAGFDIIYALQDEAFDHHVGLWSLPRAIGARAALRLSRLMHIAMVILLVFFGLISSLGVIYYIGVGIVAILIIYEQTLVGPTDLSRVNMAFFTLNGCISLIFFAFVCADLCWRYRL